MFKNACSFGRGGVVRRDGDNFFCRRSDEREIDERKESLAAPNPCLLVGNFLVE